jgi:protein-disulfide isomerase
MKRLNLIAATTCLSLAMLHTAWAQTAAAPAAPATNTVIAPAGDPSTPVTRGEIQQLVKDAIMADPEVIMQAVRKLRDKQEEDGKKASAEAFEKNKSVLLNDTVSPSIGDPKTSDVTIIEFFDYHCGYCKQLLPTVQQLVNEDKKVRVIFREYPILSEDSVTAARAALAVNRIDPNKYWDFHSALMKSQGKYDEASLSAIATQLGIDANKLKAEMVKPEITEYLDNNRKIGEDLGVRGTPAMFIGNKMLPGAVPYATLKRLVDEVRSGKAAPAPAAPAAQ